MRTFSGMVAAAAASIEGLAVTLAKPDLKAAPSKGSRPTIYVKTPWRWANLRGKFYPHKGGSKQERERRLRQIALGQLNMQNGLESHPV